MRLRKNNLKNTLHLNGEWRQGETQLTMNFMVLWFLPQFFFSLFNAFIVVAHIVVIIISNLVHYIL
jgi:hypothetical protein